MQLISHKIFLKHSLKDHIENPNRIKKALKQFEFEEATDGEVYLSKVHTQAYINKVKELSKNAAEEVQYLDAKETYVCKDTYKAACYAVGAAAKAAENARKGKPTFALVRPPGHHAHPDWTNGFCIFNNIAIAAATLVEQGERVLILDIDIHRGDGTTDCLIQLNEHFENQLYYFSINQEGIFPGAIIDEGPVRNIYVPADTSEAEYLMILKQNLSEIVEEFKPTIVGISAGFDAFSKDCEIHSAELGCGLHLTKNVVIFLKDALSDVPHFAVLEGGYEPESILEGVGAFLSKGPFEKKTRNKTVKKKKESKNKFRKKKVKKKSSKK